MNEEQNEAVETLIKEQQTKTETKQPSLVTQLVISLLFFTGLLAGEWWLLGVMDNQIIATAVAALFWLFSYKYMRLFTKIAEQKLAVSKSLYNQRMLSLTGKLIVLWSLAALGIFVFELYLLLTVI